MKYIVRFSPAGKSGAVDAGKSLLRAAQELGIGLRSDCGGRGICGKCQVIISNSAENLPPPSDIEHQILKEKLEAGYRLACRTRVFGPMEAQVPQHSLVEETVVLTEGEGVSFRVEPVVKQYHAKLPVPSLANPLGDTERLLRVLERVYGVKEVYFPLAVLNRLPTILRQADWDVTVSVWHGPRPELIDIQPGYMEDSYGAAVDIGTTTLVVYLANLRNGQVVATESMVNPQVKYGADIMSRITCATHEKGGKEQLRRTVVSAINQLIRQACTKAKVKARDISEITVACNTAMHHLSLGLETKFLSMSPFTPVIHSSCDFKAHDVGIRINPAGNVHLLPIVAGFVGGDTIADLIATELHTEESMTLLIDIGTNGELVLGNRDSGLTACSVAAGPAFEGVHIRCGMTGSRGAIEHVQIDPNYCVRYQTIGNSAPAGICGSGIVDVIAEMLKAGIILLNGRIDISIKSPRLRQGSDGSEFVLEWAKNTASGEDIVVTQSDVRQVQLAKAAFQAGTRILMQHAGVTQVDKVILAGAFGSYIDSKSAIAIGLVPVSDPEKVVPAGNTAGKGACMALLSKRKRAEALEVAKKVTYLELTVQADFQAVFLECIAFQEEPGEMRCSA